MRSSFARVRAQLSLGANGRSVALICATALITGGATATAQSLIDSGDVQDNSLRSADIRNRDIRGGDIARGTLSLSLLKETTVQELIDRTRSGLSLGGPNTPGAQGEGGGQGPPGAQGNPGQAGANGAAAVGAHWGPVARNTTGTSSTDLRNGPFVRVSATEVSAPPFGDGSLGINVAQGQKASFGNEVDFTGDPVSGLDEVGFRVFQTGENTGNNPNSRNLPNITFEVDPNLASNATNFSSLVWVPDGTGVLNRWSDFLDATSTGEWYLTGAAGTATGCNQTTRCDFDEVKTSLADGGDAAVILTATVVKGTDSNWVGAVDGLQINDEVFDFELFGTVTRTP
jgi:hypothetical protein